MIMEMPFCYEFAQKHVEACCIELRKSMSGATHIEAIILFQLLRDASALSERIAEFNHAVSRDRKEINHA